MLAVSTPCERGVKESPLEAFVVEVSGSVSTLFGDPVDSIRLPAPEQCVCDVELLERYLPARLARSITHSLLGAFEVVSERAFQIEEAVAELVTNSESYAPQPWGLRVYLDDRAL